MPPTLTMQDEFTVDETSAPGQPDTQQREEVQEEAWDLASSTYLSRDHNGTRSTSTTDNHIFFTKHSIHRIPLLPTTAVDIDDDQDGCYMDIASIDQSQQTLMDLCNFQQEDANVDGSGHCVWMGALVFVQALTFTLGHDNNCNKEGGEDNHDDDLPCLLSEYFDQRVVAEMGCGTGAAAIAVLKVLQKSQHLQQSVGKTKVWFLDNDPEAIELCRGNCERNGLIDMEHFQVHQQSSWTSTDADPTPILQGVNTILATDVLYDLTIIRPFLETAARLLAGASRSGNDERTVGHLMLSHVPRWFLPSNQSNTAATTTTAVEDDRSASTKDPAQALEEHIIDQAAQCGLQLIHTLRPTHLLQRLRVQAKIQQQNKHATANANYYQKRESELQEMEDAGAVVLVFQTR